MQVSKTELKTIYYELTIRQKLSVERHQELAARERPALKARLEQRMAEAFCQEGDK